MKAQSSRPIYAYIGQRIKERRKQLKMNQTLLAELMGLSYQQIQKYENGSNQLSVSRLLEFSRILNTSMEYFYDGIKLENTIGKKIETDAIKQTRTEPLQLLLVENNPSDVILMTTALSEMEDAVHLHTIYDSEQVMDYLQHSEAKYGKPQPDLVIMALALPKISGLQLLRLIKKNSQIGSIPVVILTNSNSKKEMREAYELGASAFIRKFTELSQYRDCIETIIHYWSKIVVLPKM